MKNLFYTIMVSFILIHCSSENQNSNDNSGLVGNENYQHKEESKALNDVDLMSNAIKIPLSREPKTQLTSNKKISKIIKSGTLAFDVESIELSKSRIDAFIKIFDGYYENENYNNQSWQKMVSLTIRVPNQHFDTLINLLEKGDEELISKNINAKDVSEEYTDLNIRLQNKLAYLNQYQEILKKAKTIEEILNVKNKIRELEEEIESKKGRILYLDDKIKYSTLNLNLSQHIESKVKRNSFVKRINSALSGGYQGFLSFTIWMVYQWPLWILVVIFWIFRKRIKSIFSWRKR